MVCFKQRNTLIIQVCMFHSTAPCTNYIIIRDVLDIRFRLAGYPAIFSNPVVPAKMVPGYLSRIVLGPF